jgi:hypothetical protein
VHSHDQLVTHMDFSFSMILAPIAHAAPDRDPTQTMTSHSRSFPLHQRIGSLESGSDITPVESPSHSPEPFTPNEIADLRAILRDYRRMSTYVDSILSSVDQIWNQVGMVDVGNHSTPETYCLPWHGHSLHSRNCSDLRPSRGTSRHQPYPGRGCTTTQLVRHASHGDALQEPIAQPPAPEPTTAVQPSGTMARPFPTQST